MNTIEDLIQHISLEQQSENVFVGQNYSVGSPNIFGGQVLAQALYAASRTVKPTFNAHSLHAYFILPGNLEIPVLYEVENIRDGRNFCTRRVLAKQSDEVIFICSISYHIHESGYEHQIDMTTPVKMPDELMSLDDIYQKFGAMLPWHIKVFLESKRAFEYRPVTLPNIINPQPEAPEMQVWFRLKSPTQVQDTPMIQSILAYISDYYLLSTAFKPHADKAHFGNTKVASIDHAIWFHRPYDPNQWHLYSIQSPSASGCRAFTTARVYSITGSLIASVSQEGLMRPKNNA